MDILSCFGMWNSCPEFVRTFQLHRVYIYMCVCVCVCVCMCEVKKSFMKFGIYINTTLGWMNFMLVCIGVIYAYLTKTKIELH
jgi:hypothetical protein